MPNYRRAFVPGGCFYFTVNLLERRRSLLVTLREAVATTRRARRIVSGRLARRCRNDRRVR